MTVTVFSPPLSFIHTRHHLFLQLTQLAGFSRSLIILGSFPENSRHHVSRSAPDWQVCSWVQRWLCGAESQLPFSFQLYLSVYPCKEEEHGTTDWNYWPVFTCWLTIIFCSIELPGPCYVFVQKSSTAHVYYPALPPDNILASSLSRQFCIQGLTCSKYSCSPFWVFIVCIISISSSVKENTKPRTAPVAPHLMCPSIFSLSVGFRSDQYFVDPVLMPGQERKILHKILTQSLFFSASIVSYNTANNKAMKSLPPAVSQRNLPKG